MSIFVLWSGLDLTTQLFLSSEAGDNTNNNNEGNDGQAEEDIFNDSNDTITNDDFRLE